MTMQIQNGELFEQKINFNIKVIMPHSTITGNHIISSILEFGKTYGLYACAWLTCYFVWVNIWLPILLCFVVCLDSFTGYIKAYITTKNPTSHELIFGFWSKVVSYAIIIVCAFVIWAAISSTFWVPFSDWTALLTEWSQLNDILNVVGMWNFWMDDIVNWWIILILVWEIKSVVANVWMILGKRKTKEFDAFISVFTRVLKFARFLIDRKEPTNESESQPEWPTWEV